MSTAAILQARQLRKSYPGVQALDGVDFDLAKHVGVRLDARAYAIFTSSNTGALCGGGCALRCFRQVTKLSNRGRRCRTPLSTIPIATCC